jgi:hypothetical protein
MYMSDLETTHQSLIIFQQIVLTIDQIQNPNYTMVKGQKPLTYHIKVWPNFPLSKLDLIFPFVSILQVY